MKISDLMDGGKVKKGMKLGVRVPTKLVEKVGTNEATGELVSVKREGRSVQVKVSIGGKAHTFRPQDLSPA